MYKLTETEVLTQPSEYIDEKNFVGMYKYETTEGDGGYLDTFNALKAQIDFNYVQYKEQLKSLVRRNNDVKQDMHIALRLLLIVALIPVVIFLILQLLSYIGEYVHFIALLYVVINMAFIPATIVCEIFLLPGMARNYVNYLEQYRLLNSDDVLRDYRESNDIISFPDEKRFLKKKIMEYDTFYELVAVEGLDRADGNLGGFDTAEMTEDQKRVLDKMRSLSVFHEYKASVSQTRKEVGIKWLIIGLGLLVGAIVVGFNFLI